MTFGDVFWVLMWLLTWATVVSTVIVGAVLIWSRQRDYVITGVGTLFGALVLFLIVMAVATGEWQISGRLLPDGCYYVGHQISGKSTVNTYEPTQGCR